jgi:hypothetical protein
LTGQKDCRSGGGSGIALDLKSRFLRAIRQTWFRFQHRDPFQIRNETVQFIVKVRIGSIYGCPAGWLVHALKLIFHLSSKVFRPKEFVNPFVELRNTGIVFSAEVHTVIMAAILNLASSSAKKTVQAESLHALPRWNPDHSLADDSRDLG